LVVSFFTFHYIENQVQAFKNVFEFLKPGGRLIIRTSGDEQPQIAEVFNSEYWKKHLPAKENWHGRAAKDYEKMLATCGFSQIKIKTEWGSRFFDGKKKLLDWAMAWIPHVTGFSGDKDLEFGNALVSNICKDQEAVDKIKLSSPIVAIDARR
jgi:SAM-dependent methyltransferase